MSMARIAARLAGFLAVLVAVLALYNYGAYLLVQNVISQAQKAPPFPTTRLETNFDGRALEGLHDGFLYQPERERPGHRYGDR